MPRLARQISLFKTQEIRELFKNSRLASRHSGLDIRVAPSTYYHGRILIITPKKMGTAPERNRIRRRLKALFYEEKLYLYPYDIIVFCKKESNSLTFNHLKNIITSAITPFFRNAECNA